MSPGAAKVNRPLPWTSVNAGGPLSIGGLLYSRLASANLCFPTNPTSEMGVGMTIKGAIAGQK